MNTLWIAIAIGLLGSTLSGALFYTIVDGYEGRAMYALTGFLLGPFALPLLLGHPKRGRHWPHGSQNGQAVSAR